MEAVWDFLSDESNQKTLAWLGGVLVTVAGGAWTAIQYIWPPKKKADPTQLSDKKESLLSSNVLADHIGFAIDGNISINNNTTNSGMSGRSLVALGFAAVGSVLLAAALAGKTVTADRCGFAAGGDIKNSCIKIEKCGNSP